jgi:secretion/DNA translocation related TadE-like protein
VSRRWKPWQRAFDGEQGSVAILAICVILALLSLTGTLAMLGQAFIQQRATESAADLAALAGAQMLIQGEQEACENARRVAQLNGTELVDCTSDAASVLVLVRQKMKSERLRVVIPAVTATSRAGY